MTQLSECTVGPNVKNPPKIRLKKFVKLTDHTCACNDLTSFEYEAHIMTGNGKHVETSLAKFVKLFQVNLFSAVFLAI